MSVCVCVFAFCSVNKFCVWQNGMKDETAGLNYRVVWVWPIPQLKEFYLHVESLVQHVFKDSWVLNEAISHWRYQRVTEPCVTLR